MMQPPGTPAPPRFPTGNQPLAGTGQARPQAAPPSRPVVAPPPIVRLQSEDETAPSPAPVSPLALPSPEQLGIVGNTAPEPTVDWTAVHRRLDTLGATCFHMEKTATGGCKVTCLIPAGQPGQQQHLEAQAASKAAAVQLVLERAELTCRSR
jgi:hypothetical protein